MSSIRELFKPSLSMMSVSLSQSFLSQGIVIIISTTLGAGSVATFSTIRTLCNISKQPLTIISMTFWGEFTSAYAKKDNILVNKLFNVANRTTILLSLLASFFLYFFGEWILDIWTRENIKIEEPFYSIFLLSIVTNVFWYNKWNFLLSVNKHTETVYYYLLMILLSLIMMFFFTPLYGLVAVALGFILVDLVMIPVLNKQTKQIFLNI
jgi:O-antigen/teichoic acid export membrane protein